MVRGALETTGILWDQGGLQGTPASFAFIITCSLYGEMEKFRITALSLHSPSSRQNSDPILAEVSRFALLAPT